MRRLGTSCLALGYGLSFVVVCLAACLMGPASADHGCCPADDGIQASNHDCCSVTPGLSHGVVPVADAVPSIIAAVPLATEASTSVPAVPIAVTASPPLVLRI